VAHGVLTDILDRDALFFQHFDAVIGIIGGEHRGYLLWVGRLRACNMVFYNVIKTNTNSGLFVL
jgi:hypothetical protein